MSARFTFSTDLYTSLSEGAWFFVSLPQADSDEIRDLVPRGRGFGSVRVTSSIGNSTWNTSIFPSKNGGPYCLPIKKAVRRAEKIDEGDIINVQVEIDFDI